MGYITPADVGISDDRAKHIARGSKEPGTDYRTAYGTDLRMPANGVIRLVDASNAGAEGRRLSLQLDDGRVVDLIHLAKIMLPNGRRVTAGQKGVCLSGASGFGKDWHYGPHVHVTLRSSASKPYSDTLDFEDYVGWGVADKQRFLKSLGLYDGEIDGDYGPKTTTGTSTFQSLVGLTVDGDFGPKTIAVAETIEGGGNFTTRPVAEIQQRLTDLGFPVGQIDGEWGNKTSLGTFRLQKAKNLTADAQYGPATDAVAFPPVPAPSPVPGRNATSRPLKDIQARLGVPQTGVWDWATSDAVEAFQKAQAIERDRVWGATSDGLAFPPAGSIHGVDYSFARPDPVTLAARGVKLAGRYLWREKYDDGRTNKGINRAELDALHAAGIKVFFIYEEDGKELLGGFDAGVRVAKAAEAHRLALGVGPVPIYFNVDYDATAEQLVPTMAALDGIASMIGLERTGLYGGIRPIAAAFDAGKITWGFQTYAWSGGVWDRRAQLQQWSNGQWGGTVDFTRAMVPDFGQHPVVIEEPEEMIEVPRSKLQAFYDWLKGLLGGGA